MTTAAQNELPLYPLAAEPEPNVAFLIAVLQGAEWTTAREIIQIVRERTGVVWTDRKVREWASESGGHVAGGQRGYKLVVQMTLEEYHHTRNWMASQASEMQRRVIEMDKVFYARHPIRKQEGML